MDNRQSDWGVNERYLFAGGIERLAQQHVVYPRAVVAGWCDVGLLNSADSALLLGTSVLVVALAGMMFVTRNIDWYAFSLPKMKASKEVTMDDQLRIWK
ncbi:inner membrane protein [Escherichia coli]|uniref:Inner membrane protein n=1 Tax=Escherichia coli TaxID=562 RepID=A0AAX2KJM8_ECOLX|nr:inner membrane protein [Escherichia coli]